MHRLIPCPFFIILLVILFQSNICQAVTNEDKISFLKQGWAFQIGNTSQDVIKNIGNPIKINRIKNKNSSTELTELVYDGLIVKITEKSGDRHLGLAYVNIKNSKYKIKNGLAIGSDENQIYNYFGQEILKRARKENNQIIIGLETITGDETDSIQDIFVIFTIKNKKILGVEWNI